MHPSEADGTGHPRRLGYVQCGWCATWVPLTRAVDDSPGSERPYSCADRNWCAREMGAQLEGWDANGAPTGIDENGDAA